MRRVSRIALGGLCLLLLRDPAEASGPGQDDNLAGAARRPRSTTPWRTGEKQKPPQRIVHAWQQQPGSSRSGVQARRVTPRAGRGTPPLPGQPGGAPSPRPGRLNRRPGVRQPRNLHLQHLLQVFLRRPVRRRRRPSLTPCRRQIGRSFCAGTIVGETNCRLRPFAAEPGTYGSLEGVSSGGIPQMIGDLGPPSALRIYQAGQAGLPPPFPPPKPPPVPRARGATMVVPSVRAVKISENQSPRPQDRVYYTINYFQGVNDQVNSRLQAPIGYTQIFRNIFGFEKTFLDGQVSLGFRMPVDTVTAASSVPKQFGNYGGTSTAVGDISIYAKYILLENRENGNLLSGGLALGVPTGPGKFAGLNSFASITNTTSFQPFLGYILNSGRWYLHGFLAVDVPANSQDVTLIYNDVGIGYYLLRPEPDSNVNRMISTIAPTFEVHVTDPLNHRNPYSRTDVVGMTDIVDLTYGLNIGIYRRTLLTFAVVTPVTSPKPFDFEAVAFVNFFFGGPRRPQAQVPPVVGGF